MVMLLFSEMHSSEIKFGAAGAVICQQKRK